MKDPEQHTITSRDTHADGKRGDEVPQYDENLVETDAWIIDKAHPYANLFPLMEGNDFAALVADIRAEGLREPIWIDEQGRILDGRNRMRACLKAGVPCIKRTFPGDDAAILRFVISKNLHRRHLDASQRAMIAAELANHRHGGDRRSDQAATLPLVSQGEAARLMNVSARSVRDAAKVKNDGGSELVIAVKKGDVSVAAAAKVAKQAREVQRKVLTGDKREVRRKIAEIKAKRKPQQAAPRAAARATAHEASTNIRQHSRHIVDSILGIGEELVRAKTKLPDGSFSQWLQSALGWSVEDAQRFIEIGDRLTDDDTEELGAIDLSVLHIAASLASDLPAKATEAPEPGILAAE